MDLTGLLKAKRYKLEIVLFGKERRCKMANYNTGDKIPSSITSAAD